MHEFKLSEMISFLAVLVSLVAVIVGPLVTFAVSKRQIVSPIRQKWIDELRELISDYLSECEKLMVLNINGILNKENVDEKTYKKLLYMGKKMQLMLNPNEEKHIKLLDIVSSITDEVHHGAEPISFGGKLRDATAVSQKILKEEWLRVKNGKI